MSFGAAFELWITQHQIKESTRRHYRDLYRARLDKPLGGRKLAQVARDPMTVENIARCTTGKTLLGIVCGTVAWAQRQGMITDNRLVRSTMHHGTVRRVREHVAYTPEQLTAITVSLGRHGITIQVMHFTGCRISEALALTPDDFSGDPGSYRVCISKQRDDASGADTDLKVAGKSRVVPVPDSLYRAVREHALRYGTGRGRLCDLDRDALASRLHTASAGARCPMTAHNFRHDYALRMERAGVRALPTSHA
jgi:integrase